jgi:hypothetical protein
MLKSGWIRLWIVLTCLLLIGTLVASSFYVWGRDVSYSFVTVSIADTANAQDRQLAESVKQEATTKTFTGRLRYSPLLTLEALARRGVVTQVAFQWLEPSGWSDKDHDELDLLNESEIRTSEIIHRVSAHVHRARLRQALVFVVFALAVSIATLALGMGVAWIRQKRIGKTRRGLGIRGFVDRHLTTKAVLAVTVLLVVASWIYPPWIIGSGRYVSHGWFFVFDTTSQTVQRVDFGRLFLIDGIILAVGGLLAWAVFHDSTSRRAIVRIAFYTLIVAPIAALILFAGAALIKNVHALLAYLPNKQPVTVEIPDMG